MHVWKIQQYIQSMWNAGEEFNVAFWVFHDHMNLYYWKESGPVLSRKKTQLTALFEREKVHSLSDSLLCCFIDTQ